MEKSDSLTFEGIYLRIDGKQFYISNYDYSRDVELYEGLMDVGEVLNIRGSLVFESCY